MLRISGGQMDQLQQAAEERLARHVARYLLDHHAEAPVRLPAGERPVAQLAPADLHRLAAASIERARRHGLSWSSSATAFAVLRVLVAPNFDEVSPMRERLAAGGDRPDPAFLAWAGDTEETVWEWARRRYEPAAWN